MTIFRACGLCPRPWPTALPPSAKAVHVDILTLGCRLNSYESEVMRGHAEAAGLKDAVIVNTCAVTAEAVRQARQTIRRARRERPDGVDHRHGLRGADRSHELC